VNEVLVTQLWRHPVKSLRGERLEEAEVTPEGVVGDRGWGIRDDDTGRILTARREPRLLLASARLGTEGRPVITLPDGTDLDGTGPATDAALRDWLGRNVTLAAAAGDPGGRAEFFADATDDRSAAIEWTMPAGRYHDSLPLLLVTADSLRAGRAVHDGAWDVRRFRPNLLLDAGRDGWTEDDWVGREVAVGAVRLRVEKRCTRCTMITRPQPGLDADVDMFRTVARHHAAAFGVLAGIVVPGVVRLGDALRVGS
jgi:MOSC domain-containing protein